MSWDPSQSTSSCNVCGRGIEAWIDICDNCIEESESLLQEFNKFASKFEELIGDGRDIAERLRRIGINGSANQMEGYLLNRMENFLNGYEMFKFDEVNKKLMEIIGEEE